LRFPASTNRSERLRIVHVAAQLETGGMERLLVEFARNVDRERFELHFVSLGARGTVADEIEGFGWQVTAMQQPRGVCPSLMFRLAGLFRRLRGDLIHTHNMRPLLYAAPAARLSGASVLHTRHGQQFGASRGALARFRLASGLAERVVCVSRDSAELAAAQGVAREKLCTIHNGIDPSRFGYTGPRVGGPAVMVGRLSPEKDVQNLIRAVELIAHEEPAFRLEIAGDGQCMASLRALTRELKLDDRIRFHGEVKDIPALLARASMFVLPSLTEGISLTLLEAMACGLPVIATRVGGTTEVIEQGSSGLLVPSGAPAELAAGMLQIYRDPGAAQHMGVAAHRRVVEHFDVRRMIDGYQNLYVQCLRGRTGRAVAA
jgi:glycosyltransferase involved in cell wall biosynthesis